MSASERLLLEVQGSNRAPAELPRAGVLVVGSDAARAGLVVSGAEVDGAHCAIARAKGGGFAVRDLGSAVGTKLNGKRIQSARLRAGDVLQLGGAELRVIDPNAPVAPAAKPAGEPARKNVPPDDETREVELETPASENVIAANMRVAEPATLPNIQGYRVERVLGRGGMGQVFLAVQESLARQVALKVLAPRLASDREFVRRFQAEARAAAALNHPNVVTVYDVGEDKGTHFLSMEYMDRGNLEERIAKDGRLTFAEALDVLRDAAQGLAFAESRGIVHRDLKPANLMRNSVGQTKIADLGLATHVESEEGQSADKKVFGTPHFMSPEQARGEKVDGRSDLYSLGATAYRLLTGHTPFEGQNAKDIVRAHLRDQARPMRDFAPDLPDGALALVARLMQKEPAARYASANELLREIERLKAGSVAASAARPRARSGGRGKLVFALVILGGAGYAGWRWYQEHEARPSEPVVSGTPPAPQPPTPGGNVPGDAAGTRNSPPSDPRAPSSGDGASNDPSDAPATAIARGTKPADDAPADDDTTLQLAEANAKVALLELLAREMPPSQKRDELRILAANFRGTTAATEARAKADEIGATIAAAEQAQAQNASALDDVLGRLRATAGLDKEPPEPGKALLALRAISSEPAFAANPLFAEARKEMERQVTQNAVRYADRVLGQCDFEASKGNFDAVQQKLTALMPLFDLPDYPLGEGPPGIAEVYQIGRSAREKLKNLELSRGAFVVKQRQDDVKAIALTYGGPQGLERELRHLDLAAARARLAAVLARLATEESRAQVQALEADVARAQASLELLTREFGNWRRKSVVDPRDPKGGTRNAVGADASGVLYEGDGGKVEHLAWGDFGNRPADLGRLFTERLTREYSAEELKGIASLLRIAGVLQAIDISSKMFDPTRKSSFTDGNARDLLECFEPALAWAQRGGDTNAATREQQAARQLIEVLQKTSQGAYSVAVTATENLLQSRGDTLLVSLLSDGSTDAVAAQPANASNAPVDAAPANAPAAPPADSSGPAGSTPPVEPPKTGDPPH